MTTNMEWGAFRSDKLPRSVDGPRNAVLLSGHLTAGKAMDACNEARRADRSGRFVYWVADGQYPVAETVA